LLVPGKKGGTARRIEREDFPRSLGWGKKKKGEGALRVEPLGKQVGSGCGPGKEKKKKRLEGGGRVKRLGSPGINRECKKYGGFYSDKKRVKVTP